MGKTLVIVESPAKAKTINKFLGPAYVVKPTGGHVVDLPEKEFGIDIENGFTPHYTVIRGKSKLLQELKKSAREADTVLLATDPDREGEAIAWHVARAVVGKDQTAYRIMFNQITRDAVVNSIKDKGQLDLNKVNAQQARRVLDRLVGYKVSPFLWKTVCKGLSAGRVQSVALRLIVERDVEIEAFAPREYWEIDALLGTASGEEFETKLVTCDGKEALLANEADAAAVVKELVGSAFVVKDLTSKQTLRHALPPFITSTLQQEAARRLGFSVTRTMRIAQALYEGVELPEGSVGLITYMRTDSTRIAPEALAEARTYIGETWGADYLPPKPNIFRAKKTAQDAHEAIRPSSVAYTPNSVKSALSAEQFRLYELIWNRFVATQMKSAEVLVATVTVAAGRYEFRATASQIQFKGFLTLYDDEIREEDDLQEGAAPVAAKKRKRAPEKRLPRDLAAGNVLDALDIDPSQHFTKPPASYTEASLVKEMEALGIGRPSTYAQIIQTLQARDYVNRDRGKLKATELGRNVNNILVEGFPDLFNVAFTAGMEEELDKIEAGDNDWIAVVGEFYGPFSKALESVNERRRELKKTLIEDTGEVCDKCGSPMVIRWGRNGKFIACSGYPKCRNTRPLTPEEAPREIAAICPTCGAPMEVKTGKYGRFLACTAYPACKTILPYTTGVKCPVEGCDGDLVEKKSKKGRLFYGCNRYPKCTFASWDKPVTRTCESCGSPTMTEAKNGETFTCPRCKTKVEQNQTGE